MFQSMQAIAKEQKLTVTIESEPGQFIQVNALEGDSLQTLKLLTLAQQNCSLAGYDFLINGEVINDQTCQLRQLNINNGGVLQVALRSSNSATNITRNSSNNQIQFQISGENSSNSGISVESMESEDENSSEVSYFSDSFDSKSNSDEFESDFNGLDCLNLNREFSFAPKLTRQYFANGF